MTAAKQSNVERAKSFVEAGFIVIPLNGKKPITSKWEQTKAENSVSLVAECEGKANNLGILCGVPGKTGHGIVIVDVDLREDGLKKWAADIKVHGEPNTLRV